VHTEFSGDWWVIRPFEVSELLASRDIPEPLSMSLLDDKEREALLMTCLCLSYAVDYLRQLWLPIAEASMKDPGLSVLDSGPTDAGASPALEEDRPVLLPDASVLSRVPAALELDAGPDRNAKACKDDKAKAPTYMWDKWTLPLCALTNPNAPLLCLDWKRGFRSLREAMLRFWKRSLLRGFVQYRRRKKFSSGRGFLEEELFAARDCFIRIGLCSVWEWDGGSRPYFWNWLEEFREDMVKGMRMWIKESLEPWTRRQRPPDDNIRSLVLDKINLIRIDATWPVAILSH
jgi:hypothetical protein